MVSILVEILHSVDGGDVEQVARISKHIFVFAFGYLSTQLYLFISCIAIIAYSFMLDISCA